MHSSAHFRTPQAPQTKQKQQNWLRSSRHSAAVEILHNFAQPNPAVELFHIAARYPYRLLKT